MEFVAGVDGGGTKTECALMNLDGEVLSTHRFGSLNLNSRPKDEVEQSIRGMVETVLAQGGTCRMLCVGSAGMSNPEARNTLEEMIRANGYAGALLLVGDQAAALYAAHGGKAGAVLISGTGSICFGKNGKGETARAGGRGYKIDDAGSGYAIGRDILSAVVRAEDGRSAPTLLSEPVFAKLGTRDMDELTRAIYTPGDKRGDLAAYAALLPQAVECGDAAAIAIHEKAVNELFLLACAVVERLGLGQGRLAFAGGILQHNRQLQIALQARLLGAYPALHCFVSETSAAVGAARMALLAVHKA